MTWRNNIMKSNENKRKYTANIVTYINGKTLEELNIKNWYTFKKGDVDTFRVNKKIDGKSIGLSQEFKSKLEAWDYLVQFEEGNIL